ncbi:DNA methyltransferase [Clostridium beijerinckii]|uniref:DNA methyltransferase n=1 Tax=Clostridium beijerinckii TaxID=1520 RepID=UPI0022DF51A3|nr:DNA methyltransferase [Clostridium beijerinckii]
MKLTKQDIDKVRHIEGFPIGSDEDIIALSNPPYYTACPNPFIEEFIKQNGKIYDEETDDYKREPFAADVSEGKNDPIYMAHSYHTKVPYKAIMKYILHYTKPGDIVFDGFCGTGMTGVAAQMCENPDIFFKKEIEQDMDDVLWGGRKAILSDIAPAATFIAYNYNKVVDPTELNEEINKIINKVENEYGWMYETYHCNEDGSRVLGLNGDMKARINFIVWSDVYICDNCGSEVVFWDRAVDLQNKKINSLFSCNKCGMEFKKNKVIRAEKLIDDSCINKTISIAKQVPVLINYSVNGKRYEKKPDEYDISIINKIDSMKVTNYIPVDKLPSGPNTDQPKNSHGIHYSHQFYTKRNLILLSNIYNEFEKIGLNFLFTSILQNASKMYKYRTDGKGGIVTGTLYIPALNQENNVLNLLELKLKMIVKSYLQKYKENNFIITCNSSTNLPISENSIDYIFTDPPFGENINYSELSFLWESWLKVKTNNEKEAIMNKTQKKGIFEYQELMLDCFKEFYRILKPKRWITVEFHNSKNSVWNAIQESMNRAGFIISDVRTLDKKQGSFKQVTTTTAVKQDLVITAYKPTDKFKRTIFEHVGSEESAWDFVREHLGKLPIVVNKGDKIEIVKEREAFLLYDRMIAYHIINGLPVMIDASDFYKGLDDRFIERDGMYFLHDQAIEYDNARILLDVEPVQFSLFVTDEKNAIAWLYQQLQGPQTYAEIQPKFIQELRTIKHEKMPELIELLEENFIQDSKERWYIPDPTKAGDIIKLREKRLIKEFEEYLEGKGKLKSFRTEAVRAGFAKLWKDKDYHNIVKVANRLPENVIQEDDKLLMYYDISLSRIE